MRGGERFSLLGSAVSMTTSAKPRGPLAAAIALPSCPDVAVTVVAPACWHTCSARCRRVCWWLIMSTEGCWGIAPILSYGARRGTPTGSRG